MRTGRPWVAIVIAVMCAVMAAAPGEAAAEKRDAACKPVAEVLGKPVCPEDLGATPHQGFETHLHRIRMLLFEEYATREGLQPTHDEIQRLEEIFESLRPEGSYDPEIEIEWIRSTILHWKVSRDLHRRHGGRVLLSKLGFHLPVDAMRIFLKDHEERGSLAIVDAGLRKAFREEMKGQEQGSLVVDEEEGRRIFATAPWEAERGREIPDLPTASKRKGEEDELSDLEAKIRDSLRKEGREIDLERHTILRAKSGEIVVGWIVYESEEEIVVDMDPCRTRLYRFRKPYLKIGDRGTLQCGDETFELSIVQQK